MFGWVRLEMAREHHARHRVREEFAVALGTLRRRKGFEVARLRVTHHLHALAGEIFREPGQSKAGTVDGRFADDPLEAAGTGDELEVEPAGLVGVKTFDGDEVVDHGGGVRVRIKIKIRIRRPGL